LTGLELSAKTVEQTRRGLNNSPRNIELQFSSILCLLRIRDSRDPQPGTSQAVINSREGGSLQKNGMILSQYMIKKRLS